MILERKDRCFRVVGKKGLNPVLDYERILGSAKAKASSYKPSRWLKPSRGGGIFVCFLTTGNPKFYFRKHR
jgi:hypothetical protein